MFTLIHGNRLEMLADVLVERLGDDPPPPLVPEVVVVQSNGMARWLSLRLARGLGIAANVRFRLPAAFLWETFRALVPDVPAASPLEPHVAVWHLRALLTELEGPPFEPLDAYVRGADERGRHELAARIADLFDQYLVYRPRWILRWEAGEDDHWQAALWRRLAGRITEPHRAHVQAAAVRALSAGPPPVSLPARISLFGIPTLPPAELEAFRRLADHLDVHLFRLGPSRHYWDRPRSEQLATASEPGHPLLAALGKQGRDFLDVLLRTQAPDREGEDYVEPGDDSLLHAFQTDLLTLRERTARLPVPDDDRSLQVHVCHGPMREVEVLHDQLHWLFEHHRELTPADVVVMTPDIDAYAPCIGAVFGGAQGIRRIPFTVADRSLRAESPLVEGFLGLLDLRGSRYEADRLLALLDLSAVHRRFGLAAGDLDLVQRLVRESAVRWGVDASMRERLGLPASPEHTWRFGLDRLVLGFALPGDDRRLRDGVLPCDAVEGSDAQVLGRLATFVDAAAALEGALAAPRAMAEWATALGDVLARFFAPDEAEAGIVQQVRATLLDLADAAGRAGYDTPVSLELVRALLRDALEQPAPRGRFLAGGVTFCAMVPMRSIPFEVVCLIGMNDGSFPRARQPVSFDLMAEEGAQPGDRSRRDDDRYLFLEAIASARSCLYLSYVGRGIRDNAPIPPSVVVNELVDAVSRGFDAPDLVTVQPLQAFSPSYFRSGAPRRLISYSTELCEASRRRGHGRVVTRLVEGRLPPAPPTAYALDLERFLDFFANPTRYLLRERLGVRLADAAQPVERREPFVLDGLGAYTVRVELLARRAERMERSRLLQELRARGLMPLGQVGAVELGRQVAMVEEFAHRLDVVTAGEPLDTIPFGPLELGQVRLNGELRDVARDGVIAYRIADPKPRDELLLWIRHLLLHVVRPRPGGWRSTWLGKKDAIVFRAMDDAEQRLLELAAIFQEGLHRLVPLLPRTSLAWYEAPGRKLERARRAWEGDDFVDGENADPHLAYAWRDLDPLDAEFERLAEQVMGPLVAHRSEDKS